jgi:hypothetical protein
MAKDEDLDIVAPSIRRASHKGDQPAQEQVDEGEKHGSSLLSERPDPTKALLTGSIRAFVPLTPKMHCIPRPSVSLSTVGTFVRSDRNEQREDAGARRQERGRA